MLESACGVCWWTVLGIIKAHVWLSGGASTRILTPGANVMTRERSGGESPVVLLGLILKLEVVGMAGRSPVNARVECVKPLAVLALSAWCGLTAGLLEVIANTLTLHTSDRGISPIIKHFVWMIPSVNFCIFVGIGAGLALVVKLWPRPGGWLSTRLLGGLALLPATLVLFPWVYPIAMLLLAMGLASAIASVVARSLPSRGVLYRRSFAVLIGLVVLPSIWLFGGEYLATWRESTRPPPAVGTPNVLLIVLDTVRADHLSLYGYSRQTTPNLERLAREGIRFDSARSTAPWTLPSHASMFTGRWPHELSTGPSSPLDATYPTLAEYLRSHGYATGGFVGNMVYGTWASGLSRGFTCYEDRVLALRRLKTVRLVELCFQAAVGLGGIIRDVFGSDVLSPVTRIVFGKRKGAGEPRGRVDGSSARKDNLDVNAFVDTASLEDTHKEKYASEVNRQFLTWLASMPQRRRPFFAFLNYMDSHDAYVPPSEFEWRIGAGPKTPRDHEVIAKWYRPKTNLTQRELQLGVDAYDNCIAYIDEQLGKLIGEMERLGVLENTLVIITADHGEEFGEHGYYLHGVDLYQTQIHVPLLIILPKRPQPRRTASEVVSLRDLPATIVDVLGLQSGAPFPGRSLTRFWDGASCPTDPEIAEVVVSEAYAPDALVLGGTEARKDKSLILRGQMVSLAEGRFVYMRNEGNPVEELYDLDGDPQEKHNLVGLDTMRQTVERFRQRFTSVRGATTSVSPVNSSAAN